MQAIYDSAAIASAEDGKLNLFEQHFPSEVKMLNPLYPGGPPVLYYAGLRWPDYIDIDYYFIVNGQVEYRFSEAPMEVSSSLYFDEGQALWAYTVWSDTQWYSIGETGINKLFFSRITSGMDSSPPYYAYCDGNYIAFDEDNSEYFDEARAWLGDQERQALINHGYSGNLTTPEETIYTLPEHSTWEELEAAFIDILCTHAQKIGQWG